MKVLILAGNYEQARWYCVKHGITDFVYAWSSRSIVGWPSGTEVILVGDYYTKRNALDALMAHHGIYNIVVAD